jgi:hypothetical protein
MVPLTTFLVTRDFPHNLAVQVWLEEKATEDAKKKNSSTCSIL